MCSQAPVCEPECAGKQCGDDGCGGSCGDCTGDQTCEAGVCTDPVPDPCQGYSFQGCCDGQTVIWCEDEEVFDFDCGAGGGCGWDADTQSYDCSTSGGADPASVHPKECP